MARNPDHTDAAFALAGMFRDLARLEAASQTIDSFARSNAANITVLLQSLRFLGECQRYEKAADLCEWALSRGMHDARLSFLAGKFASSLGRFDIARSRYLAALDLSLDPNGWYTLAALSDTQRYEDADHPDFALFDKALQNPGLNARARASILFARGKALDDLKNHSGAARNWREGNRLLDADRPWRQADWTALEQLVLKAPAYAAANQPISGFTPIFIVGMPRSGTTLLAELLGSNPQIRNRGESNLIPFIKNRLASSEFERHPQALHDAAQLYYTHMCQDDAPTTYYVDKNPLNFRYLGLIAALFPNARIIHCRRDARDTALSIWSHFFASAEYEFSHSFENIARIMESCRGFMKHWQGTLSLDMEAIDYEELVQQPLQVLNRLEIFLGTKLSDNVLGAQAGAVNQGILTSSLWQARQPIYKDSASRWAAYRNDVPELLAFSPDAAFA